MGKKKKSVAQQRKEALKNGNLPAEVREQFEAEIKKRKKIIIFSIAGMLAAIAIAAFLWAGIPGINLKSEDITLPAKETIKVGDAIEKTDNDTLIAESGDLQLYMNTSTLNFKVKNTANNTEWKSYLEGAKEGADVALLNLKYLGKDNVLYEWNTDTYCTKIGTYELSAIENGVRIAMDVNEGESNRFYEYLPKKMSIERYEEFYVPELQKAFDEGKLSQEEYDRYSLALSLVYKRSVLEECYAVTYVGKPPASATRQLIAVANLIGYTHDMLEEDAEEFGFSIAETQVPRFKINMYISLEDGDLKVRVPGYEVESLNDYFVLQNIQVLPNFGACTPEKQEKGYFFVPDGAGALIKLNSFMSGVPNYSRAIYENDFFQDYYFMSEYGEELTMPVFGEICGELGEEEKSFLGIIEDGAETAFIYAGLASTSEDGANTNRIYANFDNVQYTSAKVYGPYSDNNASYLVKSPLMMTDYTVRYKFFGEGESYYEMATAYRDYLAEKYSMSIEYDNAPALYLDVIGSLDVTDHFLGIPYSSTITMTDYSQMREILEKLSDTNLTVSYEGVVNGGLNSKINTGAKPVSKLGKTGELDDLITYAKSKNVNLALGVNLAKVYTTSIGYRSAIDSVKDYSNVVATVSRYTLSTGKLEGLIKSSASYYELVSPRYLNCVTEKFLNAEKRFDTLYVADMGHLFYADYNNTNMVSAYEGAAAIENSLEKLDAQKNLIIDDPFAKNIRYVSLATSISRESSNYVTFKYTIPFRQLVFNGLTRFTTDNVNMSDRGADYFILQAAELGAIPKFTVTYEDEDKLKSSDYTYLYAVCFSKQEALIREVYEGAKKALEEIGSGEITGHRILAQGVYETTYASGKTVLVNYNLYDVTLEDETVLEAESYIIK